MCACRQLYSKAQVLALLRLIAKEGFVYDDEAVHVLKTKQAMKALVHHNVLHYRPNTEWSYDLPARITKRDFPVLSAPSPAALFRLRQAIKNR